MTTCLWDAGVRWRSELDTAPVDLPVSMEYIRDQVLRVTNGTAEDEFIIRSIQAAVDAYEEHTQKALMAQTWTMLLDRFPCSGRIELVRPPLIEVTSVTYYDADGDVQSLAGSPAEYLVVPSGKYAAAQVRPLTGSTFPSTTARPDAVTVTFRAGYEDAANVPPAIISGIGLFMGELYKQRTLSQVGTSIVESPLRLENFWKRNWSGLL